MKHVINGIVMAAITFIVVAVIMIVSGRSVRKNELENALEHAAEVAAQSFAETEGAEISREECIDILKRNLEMSIESDSEIKLSIMALDAEKGILSVRAEEKFKNPLGGADTVEAESTLLLEKYSLE